MKKSKPSAPARPTQALPALLALAIASIALGIVLQDKAPRRRTWSGTPSFPFFTDMAFIESAIPHSFNPFPPTRPASVIIIALANGFCSTSKSTVVPYPMLHQSQFWAKSVWPFSLASGGTPIVVQASSATSAFANMISERQLSVRIVLKSRPAPSAIPCISSTRSGRYFSISLR